MALRTKECFLCGKPTTEVRKYDRIVNINPIPLCKSCKKMVHGEMMK